MKIRSNDKVKVMIGKDKGKETTVEKVSLKTGKIYLKDVNVYKRHVKGQGIKDIAKPVNASNVMVICPKCSKLTKIGFKVEDNKKTRICKKCQEQI